MPFGYSAKDKNLPRRVASASAAASRLTEDRGKLDGHTRGLVEAKLRMGADVLVATERQLAETKRDLADLEVANPEATWMLGALRDFANVWGPIMPENRGRVLRALVAAMRVKEEDWRRRGRARELQRRRPLAGGCMTSTDSPTLQDRHVLTGTLFRRRSSRALPIKQSPPPKPEPVRRSAKVARMFTLAHHQQGAIDWGLVADRAAVARKLRLTWARVTQLLDLLLLGPDLQDAVLARSTPSTALSPWPSGRPAPWPTRGTGSSSGRRGRLLADDPPKAPLNPRNQIKPDETD
ncbi:hypothetical protein WMF18_05875 [Sorangium sp. So ce315]|uniref:hypothetical protein n=1 Tax=Sorangium sp. So ce315 TaxID=3133299 RepID=UPI003F5F7ACD